MGSGSWTCDSLSLFGQEGFGSGKHETGKHNVLSIVTVGCGYGEQMGVQNTETLRSYKFLKSVIL